MSNIPLKELNFFKNESIIDEYGSLNTISCNLDVSSAWLVQLICSRCVLDIKIPTLLVTFQNTRSIHSRPLKRAGLNIQDDGLSLFKLLDLSSNIDLNESDIISRTCSNVPGSGEKPVIILECPDILIGTGKLQASQLLQIIYKLQRSFNHCTVFVVCHNDGPLINGIGHLAEQQADFLGQIFIYSSLIISLRSMPTGRANDITGILRITDGGKPVKSRANETEYLYLVKNDSTKIFHR